MSLRLKSIRDLDEAAKEQLARELGMNLLRQGRVEFYIHWFSRNHIRAYARLKK